MITGGGTVETSLNFVRKKYSSFLYYYVIIVILTSLSWFVQFHLSIKQWMIKIFESIPSFCLIQSFGFGKVDGLGHTWYLSSMMIVIFILTPILLKWPKIFSLYVAPVLSILLISHMQKTEFAGSLTGLIRAFAEISLGCTCYYIVESGILKKLNKNLLSIIALICYSVSLVLMFGNRGTSMLIETIIFLAVAVAITFYNTETFKFLNNKFIFFLGKLSLPIYLCQILCISVIRKYIVGLNLSVYVYVVVCLLCVIVVAAVCMFAGDGLRKLCNKMLFKKSEVAA